MNILFTCVGRRVELLRAFRRAYEELNLEGSIVAVDVDPLAPALQEADRRYLVPRVDDPAFVPALTELCRSERVSLVVPLTDREIPILARHRAEIEVAGARPVVLSEDSVGIASDKLRTHRMFLDAGIPTPRGWTPDEARDAAGGLEYPLFVKPRFGSAGEHAVSVRNRRELDFFLDYVPDPIVQEHLPGPEITSDVFCDLDGNVLAVVSRRRIEVRSGEVAKGVTIAEPEILDACVATAKTLGAVGPITVQCMLRDGDAYFTEVNPRFGGGVPLAIAAGVPLARWMLAIGAGLPLDVPPLGTYRTGLYLSRFDDAQILMEEELDAVPRHRL